MSKDNKIGLGKGLSAILGMGDDNETTPFSLPDISNTADDRESVIKVEIDSINVSRFQPRTEFSAEAIADLVNSIKEKGVLQPLLVRQTGKDNYELIAGERRLRAAKEAGLRFLPVIIKDFSDTETLEVALIENLQRENLNPLEEALAFQRLAAEFNRTQEEIAKVIGKSRSYITNTMRLLNLPDEVKSMVKDGRLTAGHARTLIGMDNAATLAKQIVEQGLNVRAAEILTNKEKDKKPAADNKKPNKKKKKNGGMSSDIAEMEKACEEALQTPVKIKLNGNSGIGTMSINFTSFEQLDDLIQILTGI